jgi:ABC-type spermidine/putrescine transport system permease subunit I
MVVMLYAVLQTIPVRLEEAALIHGASALRTFLRVVWPLSLPGVVNAGLTQFNLLSGLFVTASILGGGRVLTFPVFIQRTLILFNDYGMAAALSAVLVALVAAVNLVAGGSVRRLMRGEA